MDQKLLSAFHVRLLRLETDIENLTQALSMRAQLGDKVEDRAENLRREAENLRGMLRTFAGLQPEPVPGLHDHGPGTAPAPSAGPSATPSPGPSPGPYTTSSAPVPPPAPASTPASSPTSTPPAPGTRAGRLTARRRRGVRFQARVDVWDHDLDALVRCGELSAAEANDPATVTEAVEDIFDRWLQRRLGGAPADRPPPPPRRP
ncbi:MAG: hypothetical protein H6907_06500 [Hyphomicrobiales bacterium]|nr:hypothetical protein [Hyphomicrobiales bacterium]